MSLLMVCGFVTVTEGCHVSLVKPNAMAKTFYCLYSTALHCAGDVSFPGEIRIYSPFNDIVLPNNTVGFLVAKAYFPPGVPGEKILLEASHFMAVPGDPISETYELAIPDCVPPFVLGMGTVPSHPLMLADGTSRAFSVAVSDYVRDGKKTSTVQCVFEGSCTRWSRTPSPAVNSCVHFFGLMNGVAVNGSMSIMLESIVLNIGVLEASNMASSQVTSKQHKLSAFVDRWVGILSCKRFSQSHVQWCQGSCSEHGSCRWFWFCIVL
ncbi:hypothetical protein EDD17DRAFT_1469230 [Pisolithus thermaeus]|nr:hypothetical protein EDD17DRAFT_1469230 [Pisolithus thermaeus]